MFSSSLMLVFGFTLGMFLCIYSLSVVNYQKLIDIL